jgi:hypothetical protein
MVYKKYEAFHGRASKDLINAKVYQSFFEISHAK